MQKCSSSRRVRDDRMQNQHQKEEESTRDNRQQAGVLEKTPRRANGERTIGRKLGAGNMGGPNPDKSFAFLDPVTLVRAYHVAWFEKLQASATSGDETLV